MEPGAAPRGPAVATTDRRWWVFHVILTSVALGAVVLTNVVVEPGSHVATATSFLAQAAVTAFLFEAVAARAAHLGKRWAVRHFSSTGRRVVTGVAVGIVGGLVLLKVLSGVVTVLSIIVTLAVIAFILNVVLPSGSSSGADPHPGYWKDAQGRTHSRTTPPPPGHHY